MTDSACPGSGQNPSRYPTFDDHQHVECHVCGQVVRVTQRYYDGPRNVSNLSLAGHKAATSDDQATPAPSYIGPNGVVTHAN